MKHALRFAWAPAAVLILLAILEPTFGPKLDPYLHVLGGAACQYFFYNVLSLPFSWIAALTRFTKTIFAFTLTSTIATLWELGEFLLDRCVGTHLQESIRNFRGLRLCSRNHWRSRTRIVRCDCCFDRNIGNEKL